MGATELTLWRRDRRRSAPKQLGQPIFCPALSRDYAVKIARDWNVPS
jgi:hypothetical protein